MNDKFLKFLGLCRKANKLALGSDMVIDSMKKNKSLLVLITKDFSTNSLKKVESLALSKNITLVKINYNMNDIQLALGKKCGAVSINDFGFANQLKKLLDFMEEF